MDRIILICHGVPTLAGAEAAIDIAKEFAEHRPWQANVTCTWTGQTLRLQADAENDSKGLGLIDEFSDCISAYIAEGFDGEITVHSIVPLRD